MNCMTYFTGWAGKLKEEKSNNICRRSQIVPNSCHEHNLLSLFSPPRRPGVRRRWLFWAVTWSCAYSETWNPRWSVSATSSCPWERATFTTTSWSTSCSWARWSIWSASGRLFTISQKSPFCLWVQRQHFVYLYIYLLLYNRLDTASWRYVSIQIIWVYSNATKISLQYGNSSLINIFGNSKHFVFVGENRDLATEKSMLPSHASILHWLFH